MRLHRRGADDRFGTGAGDSAPSACDQELIERVTFHNEENGFCVLRVKMPGRATASVQSPAPPSTPHRAHIGYFLRGKRRAKSSAISFMVTKRTPGWPIMWW